MSRNKPVKDFALLKCSQCGNRIQEGESYYTVMTGFLEDLVTTKTSQIKPRHTFCLDPYNVILDLVPEESVSITLHLN